ncbi:MAG: RAMP superfamily CRISPR-associated protein [Clostridium sp.]|nr:RAMP superfamily CRISPR-associated protein [Clostridium sp.]MDY4079945.1 RAMP superfamily CRISPR-associated protein [Clostridium sp.]
MSRNKIHIEIKLNFYNEYFTGGGKGTSAIDCYTLKNIDGMPYIPASALKGKLRYIATEIYDSLFKKECKNYYKENEKCGCLMCSLFGEKENSRGSLNFENLYLNDNKNNNIFNERTGIQVNRYLKVVNDKALFKYETSSIGDNYFFGEINGYLEENDYKKQLLILFLAFNYMDTLGGFQSRGIGWIGNKKEIIMYVNGKEVTRKMLDEWRDEIEI